MDFFEDGLWHLEFACLQCRVYAMKDLPEHKQEYEWLCELIATEYIGG